MISKFYLNLQYLAQAAGPESSDFVSDKVIPLITQLGFGGVIGFCTGFMVKKVSKLAAVIVGLVFVLLQVLSYYGIISIEWGPVKEWWDKETSPDQLQGAWTSVRNLLFSNVPALAGAVPGFFLGLKVG